MIKLTCSEDIIRAIQIAAQTEKAMPAVRANGYGNPWRNMIVSEQNGDDADYMRPTISQSDIDVMEYVVERLLPQITDIRTRRIVWLRCSGMGWKRISLSLNQPLSRWQLKRLFDQGIYLIEKGIFLLK